MANIRILTISLRVDQSYKELREKGMPFLAGKVKASAEDDLGLKVVGAEYESRRPNGGRVYKGTL